MSVGPLTTTFSVPPSCTNDHYFLSTTLGPSNTKSWFQLGPPGAAGCFPPEWQGQTTAYFSPGVCPQGFTQATFSAGGGGIQVTDGRTTATCCPTGYEPFTTGSQLLVPFFTGEACTSKFTITSTTTTIPAFTISGANTGSTRIPLVSGGGINAYGVIIRYASGDFPTTSSTSSSSSTSNTGSATSTPTQAPDTGLSTGAKAGIGVGVALGAIIVIAAIAFFVLRRKRAAKKAAVSSPAGQDSTYYGQGVNNQYGSPQSQMAGVPMKQNNEGWQGHEMGTGYTPVPAQPTPHVELEGQSAPVELPASGR